MNQYDAEKAAKTLVKYLFNMDLSVNYKVEFGNFVKKNNLEYLYQILRLHTKTICLLNEGICYNTDSFIAQQNDYAKYSIFNYRVVKKKFDLIIEKSGYTIITKNEIETYGTHKKLPKKLIRKVIYFFQNYSKEDFFFIFRQWYRTCDKSYFEVDGVINEDRDLYYNLLVKHIFPNLKLQ